MSRIPIYRSDYLFALAGAAFSGLAAVVVIALLGGLSASYALGAIVLIVAMAAFAALPLALDIAMLRGKAAEIAFGEQVDNRSDYWTPLGGSVGRQLQGARRRVAIAQQAFEVRADEAERIVEALAEPLFVLDSRRWILHSNRAAQDIFGTELAGRNLTQVLRNPDVLRAAERCLASGGQAEIEFSLIHPVARNMKAHMRALPKRGTVGDALLLTLQDLTAVRRAEQMRVDFVANVSHELRTPLTSLGGFIETMQTVARNDEAARDRFLGIMATETNRMNRLVDDLLSLSRIEMEEHNPPAHPVALAPVVESVVDLLGPVIEERGTTVELDLPADLPSVAGDEDQLAQVCRNLLENAVKYGRPKGHVRIAASCAGRQVSLAFQDDGEGIPEEFLYRLTERFFRVEKARSRSVGGTGLGLAIVKHIVNRHRGRLEIESTVGKGSAFTVHLPVFSEKPQAPSAVIKASLN